MLSTKIATSTRQRFIIDIMPELTSLLRSDAFAGKDHIAELTEFDRKVFFIRLADKFREKILKKFYFGNFVLLKIFFFLPNIKWCLTTSFF